MELTGRENADGGPLGVVRVVDQMFDTVKGIIFMTVKLELRGSNGDGGLCWILDS